MASKNYAYKCVHTFNDLNILKITPKKLPNNNERKQISGGLQEGLLAKNKTYTSGSVIQNRSR